MSEPDVIAEAAVAGDQPKVTRQPRGADPKRDHVWPRHHARCTLALVGDQLVANTNGADNVHDALKQLGRTWSEFSARLRQLCPWVVDAEYLNFEGSTDLQKLGLQRCFNRWVVNRAYYISHPKRSEHPRESMRFQGVYDEFCATFGEDVACGRVIDEVRAQAFWISVADRVPFQAPARSADLAALVNSKIPVSADAPPPAPTEHAQSPTVPQLPPDLCDALLASASSQLEERVRVWPSPEQLFGESAGDPTLGEHQAKLDSLKVRLGAIKRDRISEQEVS